MNPSEAEQDSEKSPLTSHPRSSWKGRFSTLWTAYLIGLLLLAALAGWKVYRVWYADEGRALAAYGQLHQSIRNGDSLEHVEKLLGPSERLQDGDTAWPKRVVREHPTLYPSGVEPEDTFVLYRLKHNGNQNLLYLQFRQSRLVNHNPEEYAKLPEVHVLFSK